ncbi:Tetratricopeptide TPR_2 repeat protein [Desulfatibacillum aliphaticivorans]|uniref:Tetratricopeptide TPR_2 repeat protein n=1 Tax=Desulfatibacillum aliphaticivorans TaxID=218208 RepID=B8FF40_DESAL|nr:tetratricopeptide repeat protein [Desulfatibacillum aliphaticivorans]ACL03857.1 Tetratricopeptide TPR_2 repeat protein [Desulfatibacillum aliphaticivorans]
MPETPTNQTAAQSEKTSRFDVFTGPRKALIFLSVMVLAAYWATLSADYVNYDDITLLKNNYMIQDLSPAGVKTMFTHFMPKSYYPMRLLSYAVDYRIWGDDPFGHHVTNLLLHLFNTVLVFLLFINLAGEPAKKNIWSAFGAGAFFGLHPIAAGSVAWIPGREELLLFFFGLWCLLMQMEAAKGKNTSLYLALSAGACLLACLSNVMGAALPFLAAWYIFYSQEDKKLQTILSRTGLLWIIGAGAVFMKIAAELAWNSQTMVSKIPHVPTAILHLGDLWSQYTPSVEAGQGLVQRISVILSVFGENVVHGLFPFSLPVFFPSRIPASLMDWCVLTGLGFVLCLVVAFFLTRRKEIWRLGLVWYLAIILMTSQIFPTFVWRADRFLYLPLGGLALAAGWLAGWLFDRLGENKSGVVFLSLIVALGAQTVVYLPAFANPMAFHYYAKSNNPDYYLVYEYLGQEQVRQGMFKDALKHYAKALDLAPDKNYLWDKVFKTVIMSGKLKYGENLGETAVRKDPNNAYRRNYYGAILSFQGKDQKAVQQFKKAVELDPAAEAPRHNLGLQYLGMGELEKAERQFREAHKLNPFNAKYSYDLARTLERLEKNEEALEYYLMAAQDPKNLEARKAANRLAGKIRQAAPSKED